MAEAMQVLLRMALQLPDAEQGIVCEGTELEKRTVRAHGKAFLFLGADDAMFKLRESLAAFAPLAAKQPNRYKLGTNGWVTVTVDGKSSMERLAHWVTESRAVVLNEPMTAVPRVPARSVRPPAKRASKAPAKRASRAPAKRATTAARKKKPPRRR